MNNALSSLTGDSAKYSPASVQPFLNQLTNFNDVVQYELITRQQQIHALQAIIRFDALPHVKGDKAVMANIIHYIFNSILSNPPAGTKLLIYIKCEKERTEVMDLSVTDDFQNFDISVFTNIIANESWQLQQQPQMAALKQMVESVHGTFNSFAIEKTAACTNWCCRENIYKYAPYKTRHQNIDY